MDGNCREFGTCASKVMDLVASRLTENDDIQIYRIPEDMCPRRRKYQSRNISTKRSGNRSFFIGEKDDETDTQELLFRERIREAQGEFGEVFWQREVWAILHTWAKVWSVQREGCIDCVTADVVGSCDGYVNCLWIKQGTRKEGDYRL